jgi:Uncharacterized protein containing a Zn-ribbon (DUF2116)
VIDADDVTLSEARVFTIGVHRGERHVRHYALAPAPGLTLAEAALAAAGRYEQLTDAALAGFLARADSERQRRGLGDLRACAVCGQAIPFQARPAGARTCSDDCQATWRAKRASV